MPNQILSSTYEIRAEIGSGGGGVIYTAWHKRLEMEVVLKNEVHYNSCLRCDKNGCYEKENLDLHNCGIGYRAASRRCNCHGVESHGANFGR